MKKLIFSALFVSLGMVGALASAQPAHAATEFDDLINTTDELSIPCFSNVDSSKQSYNYEPNLNWSQAINPAVTETGDFDNIYRYNAYGGGTPTYIDDFWGELQARLDDGTGWAVRAQTDGSTYGNITIYVQSSSLGNAYFQSGVGLRIPSSYKVEITCQQDHRLVVGYDYNTRNNTIAGFPGGGNDGELYFINVPITYPSGYEGIEPPTVPPAPGVVSDYVPDWYASEAVNWVVSLHDQNFNTFDGIEWTCSEDGNSIIEGGDGLAPVLYWQVWRDDFPTEGENLLIDDGYQSATAPVMVELPINRDEAREYRVAGWYECGGDVDFTDASNFTFVVNKTGVLDESAALSNCISDEFPFIYLDDCIGNLLIFGKIALFGGATFNNNWSATTDCTTLNTMDDWLHLENPTVCPMMPSYVRNIVTPFVTFLLGLITMRFLATRTGKDF